MKSISLQICILSFGLAASSLAQTKPEPASIEKKNAKVIAPVTSAHVVSPPAPVYSPKTLAGQFNDIKEKSNTYAEYKVVKITQLNAFWKNVYDSINRIKKEIPAALNKIETQKKELAMLKTEVAARDKNLQKGEYEKSHITVLGIDTLKETYVYFSWSVIGALILALLIGFFKYNSNKRIAAEKRRDYDIMSNELNDFKQKAREKELKIGRELQTERNKIEELNQKIASLKKQVHL